MRIADHIAKQMRADDVPSLMWGDGLLVTYGREHIRGKMSRHPLDAMTAVCNAMERAPDLFEKRHARGHDSKGNARLVRIFFLKQRDS